MHWHKLVCMHGNAKLVSDGKTSHFLRIHSFAHTYSVRLAYMQQSSKGFSYAVH